MEMLTEVPSYPVGLPQTYKHPRELGFTYITGWGFLGCSREKMSRKKKTLTTSQPLIPTSEISERPDLGGKIYSLLHTSFVLNI